MVDLHGPPLTTRGLLAAIEVIRTRGSRTIIAGSVVGLIGIGLVDWWTGPDVNVCVGYALVTVFAAFSISCV